ncbi:MAG: quinone-dependent dihydroorotate dehydrogenase [Rhizobiaceae bacterium]
MSSLFASLLRPALFCLDAELAHGLGIKALKSGLLPTAAIKPDGRLAVHVAGLNFPNPLGMAAGFDKNAEVPDALLRLGFGFTEVGTITPKPQYGNPKPRVFRLEKDQAVINRLGFNNTGHDAALARLAARRGRGGIVGVNIGANKDSTDRVGDYVLGIQRFADVADYFTVNISSPNTPGLRDLQTRSSLAELLTKVMYERNECLAKTARRTPVFLKIAPDLADGDLEDIAAEVIANKVEGVIVSNTTLSRSGLKSRDSDQSGGLSGVPLFERSTIVLAKMRRLIGNDVALIGVGGINSAAAAFAKIEAGADLVQLYTGFVYEGPGLPAAIIGGLSKLLDRESLSSISLAKGRTTEAWARKPLFD